MQITERIFTPFPYFVAEQCLSPQVSDALLGWFESEAPWTLTRQDFYEQYEFSLFDADLPAAAVALVDPAAIADIRRLIGQEFGTVLGPQVELVAHKLVAGQRIGIHNDHRPGGETHRFTVQLNRGLDDDHGGYLMLFNSGDAADVHRILRPVNGTGIGFAIGPASHHAVSRMHGGERFTLVYSFHAA
jgi:Rps23 Pro-64 3,4-dihydroxylase Tpa1-like proline 4-hydroxylase